MCGSSTRNPIRLFGGPGSGDTINRRIASKTILNWASYFFSNASSLRASSVWEASILRRRTKARMISILTLMALSLFNTLDSINIPCSVKAYGRYLMCSPLFKVTICDLKPPPLTSAHQIFASSIVNWNMKSLGNLSLCLLTAWFRTLVGTP